MLLRYYDRVGIEAEFDERTGDLRLRPSPDTDRLRRDAKGSFTLLGGAVVILTITLDGVTLRVGSRASPLNDVGIEVSGDDTLRTLEIAWSASEVQRLQYAVVDWIENDPTPFVEREHFDFGLFLRNLRTDPARQLRMRRRSGD